VVVILCEKMDDEISCDGGGDGRWKMDISDANIYITKPHFIMNIICG